MIRRWWYRITGQSWDGRSSFVDPDEPWMTSDWNPYQDRP